MTLKGAELTLRLLLLSAMIPPVFPNKLDRTTTQSVLSSSLLLLLEFLMKSVGGMSLLPNQMFRHLQTNFVVLVY